MCFRLLTRRLPTIVCLGALLAGFASVPVIAQRLSFTFDEAAIASPPDGFFFASTRQASPGVWSIRGNATRRHLVHVGDPSVRERGISVAGLIFDVPQNIKVSTRLRLTEGDRAGGVVWRYTDPENFYFMSVFYRDHSASLVRVTGGNRVLLHSVDDIDLDADAWHTMTIVHHGEEIRGALDGIGILRARDRTLTDGNRAGVWSAGNTTGLFDDVVIEQAPD